LGKLRNEDDVSSTEVLAVTLSTPNFSSPKSRLIGQIFGDRYLIQSLLSQKAGRQTFIAQDTQTDRTVIIKLLLFGADFSWDDLKLFEREAAVLKSLNHPAIPQYLDYFDIETELGKGFALVQTHIAARSLQEWVQSGRTFDEGQLKSIAHNLLEILDYLHHRQPAVIHRDIKPSNILLGDSHSERLHQRSGHSLGQVYLVDFGSVQTAVNTSNTMTIVGTYGYMPPEQFGGQTSPTSDLYSLGATLIYLATGKHPAEFPQQEMQILFEQQVNLSPSFTAWLRRLTKPCIEKRFGTVPEASAALINPQSLTSRTSTGILTRPVGSKVQLQLTADKLLLIAPYGVNGRDIVQYTGTLLLPLMMISGQLVGAMFWLAPAIIALFILGMIASARSGKIQLRITPQKIRLCYQILGLTYYWQSTVAKFSDISKIELICEHHGYLPRQQGRMVKIPAQINIWIGIHRFELGKNLSQTELEWLVQELSVWLDLPVTRENSTLNRAAPYTGPSWRR
jgi:serine/threonine protein kinase